MTVRSDRVRQVLELFALFFRSLGLKVPKPNFDTGGEGGIRTHVSLSTNPVFKTGAFNRSATSPNAEKYLPSPSGLILKP